MTLKDILSTSKPVFIDFYSADCPPCLLMMQILKEVKEELKDQCEIFTIDKSKYPEVFESFGIQSLPYLKLFIKGKPVWEGSGLFRAEELILQIKNHEMNG